MSTDNDNRLTEKMKTSIGGQALIEGLLMLGPSKQAIAVRKPDGEIVVETKERAAMGKLASLPLIRGSVRLVKQMVIGVNALTRSAELQEDEETPEAEKTKADRFFEKHSGLMTGLSVAVGLLFSIGLFILLPSLITDLIRNLAGRSTAGGWAVTASLSLLEGLIRIVLFLLYLGLTRRIKDIRRVWMYPGAEHKTIACYEAREPLDVEHVRQFSRFHPRCGTSFLFLVMIISILVFSLAGRYGALLNVLIRLLLLPLVAGISYELIRLAGLYDNGLTRALSKPGLLLQRLTTDEPDGPIIEVAIAAMTAVLPEEQDEAIWS